MSKSLFGPSWRGRHIGFGEAQASDQHELRPGEARGLSHATDARKAEFAAGRAAARQALRAIGYLPVDIPMATDRSPVFPPGVVGSITHHNGLCLAVAAKKIAISGIGIDLEPDEALADDLWTEILSEAEREWLDHQHDTLKGRLARMMFSAKEATYKALYHFERRIVGFDAMDVLPDPNRERFSVLLNQKFGPFPVDTCLQGQLMRQPGHIFTSVVLPDLSLCGENVAPVRESETQCFPANSAQEMEIRQKIH